MSDKPSLCIPAVGGTCARCQLTRCPNNEGASSGAATPGDALTSLMLGSDDPVAFALVIHTLIEYGIAFNRRGASTVTVAVRPHAVADFARIFERRMPRPLFHTVQAAILGGHVRWGERLLEAFSHANPLSALLDYGKDEWVRVALETGALLSHFQPIVDAQTGEIFAYEALLRAVHPDTGALVGAGEIIAACERLNLQHVLDQVARQAAIRCAAALDLGHARIFINFLPNTIYDPEICLRTTMETAEECGIALSQLVFEVVETENIPDIKRLQRILDYYRMKGAGTAVDDLGAGFASMQYVTALRPDFAKLDRDIVRDAMLSVEARERMSALITGAQASGARVVAEGIETPEQMALCQELGVDLLQGFWFARPANPPQAVSPGSFATAAAQGAGSPVVVADNVAAEPETSAAPLPDPARFDNEGNLTSVAGLLCAALDQSGDAVLITDALLDKPGPHIVYANPAFLTMTGYAKEEILGRTPRIFQGPKTDRALVAQMRAALIMGETFAGETVNYNKRAEPYQVEWRIAPIVGEDNKPTHFVATQRDISMQKRYNDEVAQRIVQIHEYSVRLERQKLSLETANARLETVATTDGLTGLKNHRCFQEALHREFVASFRSGGVPLTLLLVDVDRFKPYNDTFGHLAGDEALRIAARLFRETCITGEEFIARYGGEEFALLLPNTGAEAGRAAAEALRASIEAHEWPLRPVTISVGVATTRVQMTRPSHLVDEADRALYQAKKAGRNRILHFAELLIARADVIDEAGADDVRIAPPSLPSSARLLQPI